MKNFALVGAAGFIAPRHLKAIQDTGNTLLAATDPHDCVGRLDSFFPDTRFFLEIERFDRFLEKSRRGPEEQHIHYVSICSPNYLHDAHVRLALRARANAICEKPLVISPWNIDPLAEIEEETGCHVYPVLQLRQLPSLLELRRKLQAETPREKAEICLTYITRRGRWYGVSWKGSQEKSGGVGMNIGIHFFDMMTWIFGAPQRQEVHLRHPRKMAGLLELERARVRWFLSVDAEDLPAERRAAGEYAYRSMTLDGQEIEFSKGFTDLHTRLYEQVLAGKGLRVQDARSGIELVHEINHSDIVQHPRLRHPMLDHVSVREIEYSRRAA